MTQAGLSKRIVLGLNTMLFEAKDDDSDNSGIEGLRTPEKVPNLENQTSSIRRTAVIIDPKEADKQAKEAKKKAMMEEYKRKVQEDQEALLVQSQAKD